MLCAWTRSVTACGAMIGTRTTTAAPWRNISSRGPEDFRLRRCVNFAVRLGKDFIGEAVLYNPDWQGGMELGCQALPRPMPAGGYGTEAFAAAADWALYGLGLARVVAKCFKENGPSYKMLSSCMRETGQDETYFYFEKTI